MEANPSTHLSPRCRSGQEDGREGCRRRVAGPAADVSQIRSLVRRHSSDAQAEQQAAKARERHQCWPDESRLDAMAPTRDRGRAGRRRPRRSPPLRHHVAGIHGSRGRAETQTQRVGRPVNRDEREGRHRFDVLSVLSFIACALRHDEELGAKPSGSTRDSPTRARSALVGFAASRTAPWASVMAVSGPTAARRARRFDSTSPRLRADSRDRAATACTAAGHDATSSGLVRGPRTPPPTRRRVRAMLHEGGSARRVRGAGAQLSGVHDACWRGAFVANALLCARDSFASPL